MSSDFRLSYPTDPSNEALFSVLEQVVSLLNGSSKFASPLDLTKYNTPGEAVVKFQNSAPASPLVQFYDKNGVAILLLDSDGNITGAGGKPIGTTETTDTLKNKTILVSDGNVFGGITEDMTAFGATEGCGLRRTTTQVIAADSALHLINWTAEDWDTNTMHDITTNNERIVIKKAGLWHFDIGLFWADLSTNMNDNNMVLKKNGAAFQQLGGFNNYLFSGTLDIGQTFSIYLPSVVNDYWEVAVSRSTGHANSGIVSDSFFQAVRHGA